MRQNSDDVPDFGAVGLASLARPSQMALVEGRAAGSATDGQRIEARRYDDATLADRMYRVGQLSTRQHDIAERVMERHAEAGFEPAVSGAYAPRGWLQGHDDEAPEAEAVTRFRELLGGCSERHAWLLHGLCLGQHPGVLWLGQLHAALDAL